MNVVSLMAHQDDEMGCLGTMLKCRERGDRLFFVTVTDGNKGFAHQPDIAPAETARIRHEEMSALAGRLGAETIDLRQPDEFLYDKPEVRMALIEAIRQTGAELIFTDLTTSLVLVTSAYPNLAVNVRSKVWVFCRKSRVYVLEGRFVERELADIYNASNVFVCTSLGEGWNLPMCEMAACGKPVIVPRNTAHTDLVNDTNAFLFDPEGFAPYPNAGSLCPWYDGMLFSKFGDQSKKQLISVMRAVRTNYSAAMERARRFTGKVRSLYTWDNSASAVLDRLNALKR